MQPTQYSYGEVGFRGIGVMCSNKLTTLGRLKNLLIEYVVVWIGLCGLFYFLFGSALQAQFTLTDDHLILTIASWEKLNLATIFKYIVNSITGDERFRPGYYLFYSLEVFFFGLNPQIWHTAFIGYGILTTFFFYLAARRIGADVIASLFFVLLLVVTGTQNSIWYRLGTGETWGLLLTSIAIFTIVEAAHRNKPNIWDSVSIFLMFLSGLPKESFILLIPALLLLRLTLHSWLQGEGWQKTVHKLSPILIGGGLVFLIEIILTGLVLINKPNGYGARVAGLSLNSISPVTWYKLLTASELATFTYYAPVFYVMLFVICRPRRRNTFTYLLATLAISLSWIIPQLIIYGDNGFSFGHYLFPVIVGFSGVCALALSILWQKRNWILWTACLLWILLPVLAGVSSTTKRSSSFTAQSIAFNEMVNYLAENMDEHQAILLVADPSGQFEWTLSVRTHLRFAGLDAPIYLLPVYSEDGRSDELTSALVNIQYAGFMDLESLHPNEVGAIIAFKSPNANTKVPSWFNPADWQLLNFTQNYYTFSLQKLAYEQAGSYEHNILIPIAR